MDGAEAPGDDTPALVRGCAFPASDLGMEEEQLDTATLDEVRALANDDDDDDTDDEAGRSSGDPPTRPPRRPDACFLAFQRRVAAHPRQVLRYARIDTRDPTPLWVSARERPTADDVGVCAWCGEPRRFEFQVRHRVILS
jgi:hypothetical protein